MSIGNPPDITGLATALICIHGVGVNGPFEKLTPLPPFTHSQIPKYGLWEMGKGENFCTSSQSALLKKAP